MGKSKIAGVCAILIAVFVWGVSFINIRVAVQVLPPMTLGALRFAIASVLLTVIMKVKGESFWVRKEDYKNLLVAGVIGITIYFYFENNGVLYTSASAASLIVASIPVFSIIIESLINKTAISKTTIVSLVLSVTGVILVVGLNFKELVGTGYLKGYLMMGGAVISWVAYSVSSKPLFDSYNQLKVLFYQAWIGLACFIPFAAFEKTDWSLATTEIWVHVAILGVFASAIGFYTYLYALDVLGIGESSYYLNLIPVVTIIIGIFYLGEKLNKAQLFGGALIIASVIMVSSGKTDTTKISENIKAKSA